MKQALHFVGIAGIGWLADTALFFLLVWLFHMAPFPANVAGGLLGASITFLASRERIFTARSGSTPVRLGLYLAYTLGLLVVASAAVQGVALLVAHGLPMLPAQYGALAAKCLVTPFTLALNFFAAKVLNTR